MAKAKLQRSSRIYLNFANTGKKKECFAFLNHCRNLQQYFVDLFWQRKDCKGKFTDLVTVHRGRDRFSTTTRLAQAMAKQAKEALRHKNGGIRKRKPRLRQQTVTLYYHFANIEYGKGAFNYVLNLTGSGAPKLTIPFNSTSHLKRLLANGYAISKTVRLGRDKANLWLDVIVEKPKPKFRITGKIVGMDSNLKNGFHFSDGQVLGESIYDLIKTFDKREKNTHEQVKQRINETLKRLDCSQIKLLVIENLKYVKHHKRGTFPRQFNRRLSHWLYSYFGTRIEQICEELGIRLDRKNPAYSSQFCRSCFKWDRRNRKGDVFECVTCGEVHHADTNAAKNMELLGLADSYGIRSLASSIWML